MDINAITQRLKRFIKHYHVQFEQISKRETQLLELAAVVGTAEHYKSKGYTLTPHNLQGRYFKVKTSANGRPWNFSWFEASKGNINIEIHCNLPVFSSYTFDYGVYVVDVAVIKNGALPEKDKRKEWKAVNNQSLITFVEVKKLVIYPMLLAQFVGIVHEIKPNFLGGRRPKNFVKNGHFNPALLSISYMTKGSRPIKEGYKERRFKLTIIENFDVAFALRRSGQYESPLEE